MGEMYHRATGPVIQQLRNGWEKPKEDELRRLLNRLPNLEPRAQEEIRQSFDRLVNKLLHPPLESLRDEVAQGRPARSAGRPGAAVSTAGLRRLPLSRSRVVGRCSTSSCLCPRRLRPRPSLRPRLVPVVVLVFVQSSSSSSQSLLRRRPSLRLRLRRQPLPRLVVEVVFVVVSSPLRLRRPRRPPWRRRWSRRSRQVPLGRGHRGRAEVVPPRCVLSSVILMSVSSCFSRD